MWPKPSNNDRLIWVRFLIVLLLLFLIGCNPIELESPNPFCSLPDHQLNNIEDTKTICTVRYECKDTSAHEHMCICDKLCICFTNLQYVLILPDNFCVLDRLTRVNLIVETF